MPEGIYGREPDKPTRKWAAVIALTCVVVAFLFVMVWWLKPPVDASKEFDNPKITSAFVDGEPFMRLKLNPGDQYRPIQVMKGTNFKLECFVVETESKTMKFIVHAFGKTFELNDCVFNIDVTDPVGKFSDIKIEYLDGDSTFVDSLDIPIAVVQKSERVEFHQLQNSNRQAVMAGGVPDKLYIYGRAITSLPGESAEYGALFFVADPANDVPVLQLMPLLQGDEPKPMVGPVVRYRNYGKDLAGYALWSPEMVNISPVNRKITDIYIGIFKKIEIDDIFKQLLKVEISSEDTVTVTPLVSSPYDVMQLTVGGKLLSESFHVVFGAGRAVIDERVKTMVKEAQSAAASIPVTSISE